MSDRAGHERAVRCTVMTYDVMTSSRDVIWRHDVLLWRHDVYPWHLMSLYDMTFLAANLENHVLELTCDGFSRLCKLSSTEKKSGVKTFFGKRCHFGGWSRFFLNITDALTSIKERITSIMVIKDRNELYIQRSQTQAFHMMWNRNRTFQVCTYQFPGSSAQPTTMSVFFDMLIYCYADIVGRELRNTCNTWVSGHGTSCKFMIGVPLCQKSCMLRTIYYLSFATLLYLFTISSEHDYFPCWIRGEPELLMILDPFS